MKYLVKQTEQNNAKEKQMRAKEFMIKEASRDIDPAFDLTDEMRDAIKVGWILKDRAAKVKDDRLSVAMSRVGDELTDWKKGAYGSKSLEDVAKKSLVPLELVKKLVAFAKQQQSTMPDQAPADTGADDSEKYGPSDDEIDAKAKAAARAR